MDNGTYLAMRKQIEALEERIARLEERAVFNEESEAYERLMVRYPTGRMSKTQAAEEIGVARASIYNMVEDGRLQLDGMGKVTVKSVARLLDGHGAIRRVRRERAG